MLIVVAFVRGMQVTIVEVIYMVAVLNAQVAAVRGVDVGMLRVGGMGHGGSSF
jgi:hypothetical protein